MHRLFGPGPMAHISIRTSGAFHQQTQIEIRAGRPISKELSAADDPLLCAIRFTLKNKVMQNPIIVGIDVSCATLDICVRRAARQQQSFVIKNQAQAIRTFLKAYSAEALVIGMENTGRYNWALYEVLAESHHRVFVLSPLHLYKSMGLIRGKNDRIDAVRIAAFTACHYQELRPWQPCRSVIQQLKVLLSERAHRIKAKAQLLSQRHDYARMKHLGLDKELQRLNARHIKLLDEQLTLIEARMQALIRSDAQLSHQAALISSVPGVGKVLCWMMLAKTEGFSQITEPRQMACYSGVVPFTHQSGTSLKGKDRVSVYADKALKTILHMAAMSAIRLKNELRDYYLKKVAEGKSKMSVLNAVRNKIIHRIYAVIKHQKTYINALNLS